MTLAKTSSIVKSEVSNTKASSAGFNGATALLESRSSRAFTSAKTSTYIAQIPFSCNSFCRLFARISAEATKNSLISASGQITVPMSRPSKIAPLAGVPSGPVIQDLVVPTTVEMGSKLNVTVKIGMVR